METYNLNDHLAAIYSRYPEAKRQPVIGITANYGDGLAKIMEQYYEQVLRAGGVPLLIPPTDSVDALVNTLSRIDGLLLTGGADYNPLWAGEQPSRHLGGINSKRDLPELLITRLACNRQIPTLGICRGIQTLAMALGGKVEQDIYEGGKDRLKHSQDAPRSEYSHTVSIAAGTMLASIYGEGPRSVNSFHHQAVGEPGPKFRVSATAPDGVIEAIESAEHKSVLGVQWHPEWLGDDGLKLFQWLTERAREYMHAKDLHSRILTVDSHCDTPMFFPQGIDFGTRDSRILVDLHKMTDGRQDAVCMVAYLPQPKPGQTFKEIAPLPAESPKAYADLIFDKITAIINEHPDYIAQARTPDEIRENKLMGRKSIVFGIENGLALENDINLVDYFARRGVVYITLCHNGDNDICDSARGTQTHNGVSAFGRKVIERMNDCGLMVDLSHASEKSFFDALELSRTPIVCSHSCCKALCKHPRNLSDEQLRALARRGGVAQITLYHGFLRSEGEASIDDALAHLRHAIDVMGIEHVGFGSDFDGDGGVPGIADSSELLNYTMHLLRHRYSDHDISLILGGNWLRVMGEIKKLKD